MALAGWQRCGPAQQLDETATKTRLPVRLYSVYCCLATNLADWLASRPCFTAEPLVRTGSPPCRSPVAGSGTSRLKARSRQSRTQSPGPNARGGLPEHTAEPEKKGKGSGKKENNPAPGFGAPSRDEMHNDGSTEAKGSVRDSGA
ncbi:proton-dependent oligopeptide transporter, POT family [Anopheles sinensis]|uniref:Proton-dependent oligopeptide transporter, POT family n=1 Tax=Anopheles sinensis TaxID=74873 RepID=A0A084VY84_ANOSI|nr:proton-dependent oligopeptide transporter, POT family [Anopheles sinensis]